MSRRKRTKTGKGEKPRSKKPAEMDPFGRTNFGTGKDQDELKSPISIPPRHQETDAGNKETPIAEFSAWTQLSALQLRRFTQH
jgi:hypothetical protein